MAKNFTDKNIIKGRWYNINKKNKKKNNCQVSWDQRLENGPKRIFFDCSR